MFTETENQKISKIKITIRDILKQFYHWH